MEVRDEDACFGVVFSLFRGGLGWVVAAVSVEGEVGWRGCYDTFWKYLILLVGLVYVVQVLG